MTVQYLHLVLPGTQQDWNSLSAIAKSARWSGFLKNHDSIENYFTKKPNKRAAYETMIAQGV